MAIELSEKQIKDGWQIVKFGEIAKNISKRVEPSETDLEVYVGLEHLDPQSLRITRRGVPADVKGQKLRVRPGQIIFGKRRAYQKKIAVADFEGICSAHAMVLEEVVGKIIPGLLPFFMQSDMFMDRAVAISEGSLSPTIKWKTLAIQEFPLPPIERQQEILEMLEKVEENIVHNINTSLSSEQLIGALLAGHVSSIKNKNVASKKLRQIGVWKGGGTPSKANKSYWTDGTIPWVSSKDMGTKIILDVPDKITDEALKHSSANLIEAESILFVTRSGILRHTLPVALTACDTAINQDIKALTCNDCITPKYLWVLLTYYAPSILYQCVKTGTTVESIDFKLLKDFEVPVPSKTEQTNFVEIWTFLKEIERQSYRKTEKLKVMRRQVVDQLMVKCGSPQGASMRVGRMKAEG